MHGIQKRGTAKNYYREKFTVKIIKNGLLWSVLNIQLARKEIIHYRLRQGQKAGKRTHFRLAVYSKGLNIRIKSDMGGKGGM